MQIPLMLHAPYETAKGACAKAIRAFLGGESWNGAIEHSSMLDTSEVKSFLVLNGPAPLLGRESHFQLFLPLSLLLAEMRNGRADSIKCNEAVLASLSTPWGILGVLAPKNQMVVYPPQLHRTILSAVATWWDTLDAVGPRYTLGLREGTRLWNTTTNLQYVMGQLGIEIEKLQAPLPKQGLRAIIPNVLSV
jgi:hypothetical protein